MAGCLFKKTTPPVPAVTNLGRSDSGNPFVGGLDWRGFGFDFQGLPKSEGS